MGDLVEECEDPSGRVVRSVDSNQGCVVTRRPESADIVLAHWDIVLAHCELYDQNPWSSRWPRHEGNASDALVHASCSAIGDARLRALDYRNLDWILARSVLTQAGLGRAFVTKNPRGQLLKPARPANLTGFFGTKFVIPKTWGTWCDSDDLVCVLSDAFVPGS